jgi:hypothetical protein
MDTRGIGEAIRGVIRWAIGATVVVVVLLVYVALHFFGFVR